MARFGGRVLGLTFAGLGTVLAVAAIYLFADIGAGRLSEPFGRLRVGMSSGEVEAVLGPPVPQNPTADRHCVGTFDDVDAPPLILGPIESAFWYDGTRQRVRVRYRDGKLWDAKINHRREPGTYLR